MADATYQTKAYFDNQGDRFNVVSGGALNIEAGSTNTIAGALTVSGTNTFSGVNTFSGALRQTDANANASTAGAPITGEGRTVLSATAGAAKTFALAAPVNGAYVHIIAEAAGSSSQTVSSTASGATIGTTFTSIAFTGKTYGAVTLRGRSTAIWDVIGQSGANVAFS